MPKVLVADDHALVRDGIRAQLAGLGEGVEVVEAEDWTETFARVEASPDLDIALVDLRMPGKDGMTALGDLLRKNPALPIVVLSATDEVDVMRDALRAGAMGYVAKTEPSAVLLGAIRLVLDGGMYVPPRLANAAEQPTAPSAPPPLLPELTPRQRDVLALIAEGRSNQEIARALDLALATVKVHLAAIFRALGVSNRTQAAVVAQRHGLGGGVSKV